MDFLGVCDSGEWGDTSDAKDLHSKLFSPQTGAVEARPKSKKFKATKKKQATVGEKQSDSRDIHVKKPRENKTSAKLQHGSVNKETETSGTSVKREKVTTKKKKKRKIDTSESEVPVKKKKAKKALPSTATPVAQGEQNKELNSQQNDDNETLGEDRTINVDQIKKKRKRKPRNNKFKTAEFGYVAKPSETRTLDAESEIRNQNGKSIARTLEVKGEVKDGNKKVGKKRSKKRKVKKPAKTQINQRTPSKNNVDRTKDKSEGFAQLSSPGDKVQKKASENLDQKSKTENDVSEERTKRNRKMKRANVKIDSQLSKEEIEPVDRQHLKSATKCEKLEGGKLAVSQDEDISEEPLPDLSAKQALKSKMEAKLQSAHFRFLNERLYKTTGSEAQQMMAQDRESFDIYHRGFAQQVRQWPVNPVDKFIEDLKSRPENLTVGDFGCGDAQIARSVSQTIHSFDLCALNEHVTVCDMEKVPLKNNCLDVAIFCLSLMGTNWISYIKEANRVLKMKGQLKIAEVASRFASVAEFLKIMKQLGFKKESKDFSNKMFLMFDFTKEASTKKVELERGEVLKPCLYKRR
ncbi:25S rRNA (adenine(645)-N(1))-methyltransferase-like [Patiria miniata]|uniref:Ribosomal RNA-processing protein 8 n=1 Tax=Patiria miniata TaxID=46514 RepID=A0A914AHC0_PATMI|nr:25S rRNA (adenine(645)-N(1))-methyltransferase-like [Patiria miniata]XP_038063082.1 25S rRNA (adenine(645)-N(1))-methyltransferase-like [Patiria miniata]XP_038063083.1 25S rRNA (adenine(645)-N(1))-methyltransferase-like [Patiria miniata]